VSILRVLFIFSSLVVVGMGVVTLRTDTRQTGYMISRMRTQQQTLKRTCLELELELARLSNPTRLATERERLSVERHPPVLFGSVPRPAVMVGGD